MGNLEVTLVLLTIIIFQACSSEKQITQDVPLNAGDTVYSFYYSVEGETEKLEAEPMANSTSLRAALNNITNKLTEKYSNKGNVVFELESLNFINTGAKDYKIAVINIADSGNMMERNYFQGSTGGMFTQTNILMSLLQPQIDGFLDGCIIHLNGKPVGVMDHVNFEGIINPSVYLYKAKKAILEK